MRYCATAIGAATMMMLHIAGGGVVTVVFLSSNTDGLQPERKHLPALLIASGFSPRHFEEFPAQDRASREACLRAVAESDIYVLLLGAKYGEPVSDSGVSPTEEEYNAALEAGIQILVFVKNGVEFEPRQEEFMERVGRYQDGRFWKTFNEALDLGVEVASALRALPEKHVPLAWQVLASTPQLKWRIERFDESLSIFETPILEVQLIPVAHGQTFTPVASLPAVAEGLASASRADGFFCQSDHLRVGSDHWTAFVRRLDEGRRNGGFGVRRDAQTAGLLVDRDGTVMAYEALPADLFGTLISISDLSSRVRRLLILLAGQIDRDCGLVAMAAGIEPATNVYEGDPALVGNRNSAGLRTQHVAPVRTGPEDGFPAAAIAEHVGEIADEIAARLMHKVRALSEF